MKPLYFTDRDLGREFPAILREAGILVAEHADHFAHNTADDDWLAEVGWRGWIALSRDRRIRYRPNECDAVVRNGVGLFILIGKVSHRQLANGFVHTIRRVERFLGSNERPFIAKVRLAALSVLAGNPKAAGTVEMWLTAKEWAKRG